MTDNFSNDSHRRIFGAQVPPVLRANYERLPAIKKQIEECLRLSERELTARLAIADRRAANFLREETLVCLLTLAHSEERFQMENLICERLFAACRKRVAAVLRTNSFDEIFIEEAVGEIQYLMLEQIFERAEKSYDFWEVMFYKTLSALVSAYRRKHAAKHRATRLFSELSDDENDYENNLVDDENYSDRREKQMASRRILAEMPKDLRRIFVLYHVEEETQQAIAETFGTTARTVRNKLRRIEELLDAHRQPHKGEVR